MKFLLNFVNKKMTFADQKRWIIFYCCVGFPLGYLFSQLLSVLVISWEKYNFTISNLLYNIIFNFLIFSPILIAFFKNKKKYKKLLTIINNEDGDKINIKLKCIFDYGYIKSDKEFIKNEIYDIQYLIGGNEKPKRKLTYNDDLYVPSEYKYPHKLKTIINKFDISSIKIDRKRKLKKLYAKQN